MQKYIKEMNSMNEKMAKQNATLNKQSEQISSLMANNYNTSFEEK